MNPLSTSGAPTPTIPTPAPARDDSSSSTSSGGDLLAAMRPAMDAAFAVGRPTNEAGAAAILATTGDYVRGAQATMTKVQEGIASRREQIAALQATDPARAAKLQEEVNLLDKLHERIQLSIERVTSTTAGSGDDEDEVEAMRARAKRRRAERDEQLELLAKRRELLGSQVRSMLVQPMDASMVAATYASASGTDVGA